MRRDANQIRQNDYFGVILDTFHDRRNGFCSTRTRSAARADQDITDESNPNTDWNPCGTCARADSRAAGPSRSRFRSSRCVISPAPNRSGASTAPRVRRKNEWAYLTPMPLGAACRAASSACRRRRRSLASRCRRPRNIEMKPYGIARHDRPDATPRRRQRPRADVGIDVEVRRHRRTSPPTSPTTPTSRRSRSTSSR